jgi:hypothetical protein
VKYFLGFVEDERRWYVFAPTVSGLNRLPVYIDTPAMGKILLADESKQTITN